MHVASNRIVYARPRCVCMYRYIVRHESRHFRLSARPLPCTTPSILLFPETEVLQKPKENAHVLFLRLAELDQTPPANRQPPSVVSARFKPAGRCVDWNRDSDLGSRPGGRPGGRSRRNCYVGFGFGGRAGRAGSSSMAPAKVTPSSAAWCVGAWCGHRNQGLRVEVATY